MNGFKAKAQREELLKEAFCFWPESSVGEIMWTALEAAVERARIARLREEEKELQARIKKLRTRRFSRVMEAASPMFPR
jgi:hypothetical protein